jgi:uncharacterized protein YbjT (DUF2867 family)
MSDKKIIAVVGATGAQGGGLARAILAEPDGEFAVRALTRDPGSPTAKELADSGAEVVAADLDDEAGLRAAFDAAHGVYLVTNYWADMSAEHEIAQAANGARAAQATGIQHLIWSTLEDTRAYLPLNDPSIPVFEGRYTVPHFDAKSEADKFFAEGGVPTTYLRPSMYWEAFDTFGFGPRREEDGALVFSLPMGDRKLAGIAAADIGRTALGIFRRGGEFIGRTVGIAGEHLTGHEFAVAFADSYGEPVAYRPLTFDEFREQNMPAAAEVGNMFEYYYLAEAEFTGSRDLALVRSLNPHLQTFRSWLRNHPVPAQ